MSDNEKNIQQRQMDEMRTTMGYRKAFNKEQIHTV